MYVIYVCIYIFLGLNASVVPNCTYILQFMFVYIICTKTKLAQIKGKIAQRFWTKNDGDVIVCNTCL